MIDLAGAARQWACQQCVVRLFQLLDARSYEDIVQILDPGAVWRPPGAILHGHEEIRAALHLRPAQRATRHVVANFLVTHDDGALVRASCSLMTYAMESSDTGVLPSLVEAMVGLFRARVSLTIAAGEVFVSELELAPDWTFARNGVA